MRKYKNIWVNTAQVILKKRILRSTGGSRVKIAICLENARRVQQLPINAFYRFATCKKWEGGCGCDGRTDRFLEAEKPLER